jgi:hypothetical protein
MPALRFPLPLRVALVRVGGLVDLEEVDAVARAVPFRGSGERLTRLGARVGTLGKRARGEKRHVTHSPRGRESQ